MTVPLARFCEEMKSFLLGHTSADQVLARIGPSPSGSTRFAVYAELVARQRRGVVDHFMRPVAAALGESFPPLRDDYLAEHPPSHWVPSEAVRAFPDYVAARTDLPPFAAELADFAWIRYAVMIAAHDDDLGLDCAVYVRHYEHDVVAFSRDVEDGGLLRGAPAKKGTTLLVTRHRSRGSLSVVTPSAAALVVLAIASGAGPRSLPPGLARATVTREASSMARSGLVPAGTAALVDGWLALDAHEGAR